jgi:hypothetical protein
MFRFLVALALLLPPAAFATDALVVDAYTFSADRSVDGGWNRSGQLSWEHESSDTVTTGIGIGPNVFGKMSISAGAKWEPMQIWRIKYGLWGALVTGYTCDQLKTCAVVGGLVATAIFGHIEVEILHVPRIGNGTKSVSQLRLGIVF